MGRWAEATAQRYLEAQGYTVLARRFRVPAGEIDLVARDGATLCFVEVRARSAPSLVEPLATIGPRKRARLVRAARAYVAGLRGTWPPMRFDAVGLVVDAATPKVLRMIHVIDAFDAHGLRRG